MRLALCLLLVLASAPLAARDVKHSDANGACASASEDDRTAAERVSERKRAAAPTRDTRVKPSQHSDSGSGSGRSQPLRWHSFLPGMVR